MKINDRHMRRIAEAILKGLKNQKVIQFKEKEDVVLQRADPKSFAPTSNESPLDAEVMKMLDDLERQNPGEFQRYKMFPLLKKRLAKEKKIIL